MGKSVSGGWEGFPENPRSPMNFRPRRVHVGLTENNLGIVPPLIEFPRAFLAETVRASTDRAIAPRPLPSRCGSASVPLPVAGGRHRGLARAYPRAPRPKAAGGTVPPRRSRAGGRPPRD